MFKLLRLLVWLVLLGAFVWFGFTVKLGKHTLFGHVRRIWHSEEAQDLVEGAKEKAGPAYEHVKRGVEKGIEEATRSDPDAAPAPPRAQ